MGSLLLKRPERSLASKGSILHACHCLNDARVPFVPSRRHHRLTSAGIDLTRWRVSVNTMIFSPIAGGAPNPQSNVSIDGCRCSSDLGPVMIVVGGIYTLQNFIEVLTYKKITIARDFGESQFVENRQSSMFDAYQPACLQHLRNS